MTNPSANAAAEVKPATRDVEESRGHVTVLGVDLHRIPLAARPSAEAHHLPVQGVGERRHSLRQRETRFLSSMMSEHVHESARLTSCARHCANLACHRMAAAPLSALTTLAGPLQPQSPLDEGSR